MNNEKSIVLSIKTIDKLILRELEKSGIKDNMSIFWNYDCYDDILNAVVSKTINMLGKSAKCRVTLGVDDIRKIVERALDDPNIDIISMSFIINGTEIADEETYSQGDWDLFDETEEDDYDDEEIYPDEYKFNRLVVKYNQKTNNKYVPRLKK